ncbi:MAG: selenocysteine-specific translation elongation factor, partial [Syntrophaceae bacterium]
MKMQRKKRNIILGTAGHIDHGKTAFIRALTGIECDLLQEEKRRGITIVLGYAHMHLPSGIKVGIVDVPGHERFVNRMVAGAAGIDAVALLIAADEGIKPQTREHLYICDILGIRKGIVVLNKMDLVDDETLLLQIDEIEKFTAGTFLEGAPVIPVSSVTGEGLGEFTAALDRIAAEITLKPQQKPFRLPVDAVVTITGFGTVVRGTAQSGSIGVGEEIMVLPEGRKYRIRSLQNHGAAIE